MVEFPIMYMNSTFVDWGKEGYFRQGKVSLKLSQEGLTSFLRIQKIFLIIIRMLPKNELRTSSFLLYLN